MELVDWNFNTVTVYVVVVLQLNKGHLKNVKEGITYMLYI